MTRRKISYARVFSMRKQHGIADKQVRAFAAQPFELAKFDAVSHETLELAQRRVDLRVRNTAAMTYAFFLAMGFLGPEKGSWLDELGVQFDARGNVSRGDDYMSSVDGVFVAGDAGRGQSLIVWAIAEGRAAAAAVDKYLTGATTLPSPIPPTERPLMV